MTVSEILFESILSSLKIDFEKIPESNKKRPDYKVGKETISYWEIKEITKNPDEKKIITSISHGEQEVYSVNSKRVENSIKDASVQLKSYGDIKFPRVVVLHDARDFFVKDLLFDGYVKSAMLGVGHYKENVDGELVEIYRKKGLFSDRKRYISTVAIMYAENNEIVFFHNPHSNNPLIVSQILDKFPHHYRAVTESRGLSWVKV